MRQNQRRLSSRPIHKVPSSFLIALALIGWRPAFPRWIAFMPCYTALRATPLCIPLSISFTWTCVLSSLHLMYNQSPLCHIPLSISMMMCPQPCGKQIVALGYHFSQSCGIVQKPIWLLPTLPTEDILSRLCQSTSHFFWHGISSHVVDVMGKLFAKIM